MAVDIKISPSQCVAFKWWEIPESTYLFETICFKRTYTKKNKKQNKKNKNVGEDSQKGFLHHCLHLIIFFNDSTACAVRTPYSNSSHDSGTTQYQTWMVQRQVSSNPKNFVTTGFLKKRKCTLCMDSKPLLKYMTWKLGQLIFIQIRDWKVNEKCNYIFIIVYANIRSSWLECKVYLYHKTSL